MPDDLFPVPISLHVFNRPDLTRKVFQVIKHIKPDVLFISADGPRENVTDDVEKCREVRRIVSEVDWKCDVHTNFSEINKGCDRSIPDGITWVFEHVDKAIMLEDDCIPHESFFQFCHEMLSDYENDKRISIVSGNNFQLTGDESEHSYYFSRYSHSWGWATWKRTWDRVDLEMKNWPGFLQANGMRTAFSKSHEIKYWEDLYQEMYDGYRWRHWDYLLQLSLFMNDSLAVLPCENLVTNIGFGSDATNCEVQMDLHSLKSVEMFFPLNHPPSVSRNVKADDYSERKIFSGGIRSRIKRKIIACLSGCGIKKSN